jgi:hypothetical protein
MGIEAVLTIKSDESYTDLADLVEYLHTRVIIIQTGILT